MPKVKILLVDDRENNLLSMESILEQDRYHLVRATSGFDALKILLKDFDFTLILMDVEMPNMNGLETATMIYQREKLKHIPIIFITAHSYGDDNIFKGYKAGAVDYIYKPIQPDLLRAKVAVFVDLYRKNHLLLEQEQKLKAINKSLEIEIRDRITSEEKIKDLNQQLLKNIEKLESTNKELDQFAFIASHDLQEPLRKIRMFNDFIVSKYRDKLDGEGEVYLDRMQVACGRMQSLINDILTFSKIDVSKETLVYTDLNTLMSEVIEDMELLIKEKNAVVSYNNLPKLYIYPGLIKLLFQHLINNSLKFSNKNVEPVIRISAKMSTPDEVADKLKVNKYWRISVKDNGVGFEQQYAEQIFSMFKRLHGNSEYSGTGVGLSICKKIIEVHHGYISTKSVPDKGTVFTISLPSGIAETLPVTAIEEESND
ncbi:MAG: response regulator [Bacteroidota bacterium]